MAAETIREFLIALGFKVDQPTLKKFEDAITGATFKAGVLAQAFVGMAKALAESLQNATKDLSNLYYTSVRVGSSATNLKALTQASQDFGVSAEEALGNIESLAQLLRTSPGKEAFINSLGVQTRDANGALRDTVAIANDLGKVLAQRPDYMAQQLADVIGLTYKFRKAIQDPGWLADLEKHQRLLEHSGYDKAARDAALLEQQFRELGDRWDTLKMKFAVNVFEPVIEGLEEFTNWLDKNTPGMMAQFENLTNAMGAFAKAAKVALDPLLSKLESISEAIERKIPLTKWVNNLNDWIGTGLKGDLDFVLDKLGVRDQFYKELNNTHPPDGTRRGPSSSRGVRTHNPGNLEYAGQPGAVRAGGGPDEQRFAAFRTDREGLGAMANQLELDFQRGRKTIEALVAKYAPPEENDTVAYIADVARQMHVGSRTALNLKDPAVLESMMNAMIAHENMNNPYRPGLVRDAANAAVRGGANNVTLNSTINIDGSKDVTATKRAVNEALTESFRKATRNLQPTAQ